MYDLGFFLSLFFFSHKKRVIIDESCFDLISFFLVLIWIITASFLIVSMFYVLIE